MLADWHWARFSAGAIASLPIALPALLVLSLLRRFEIPAPAIWGLLLAAGAVLTPQVGLPLAGLEIPATWVLAIAVAGAAGASYVPGQPLLAAVTALLLQPWLQSTAAVTALGDAGHGLVAVGPLAAVAVSLFDDRYPGAGPPAFALTIAGMYLAVPDTELAFPLVGVVVPLSCLGRPLFRFRIGGMGAAAAVSVFLWVLAAESVGRPGSAIGAGACLGVLLAEPAARLLHGGEEPGRAHPGWILGLHAILVAVASRGVALAASPTTALTLALPLLAGAAILIAVGSRHPLATGAAGDR